MSQSRARYTKRHGPKTSTRSRKANKIQWKNFMAVQYNLEIFIRKVMNPELSHSFPDVCRVLAAYAMEGDQILKDMFHDFVYCDEVKKYRYFCEYVCLKRSNELFKVKPLLDEAYTGYNMPYAIVYILDSNRPDQPLENFQSDEEILYYMLVHDKYLYQMYGLIIDGQNPLDKQVF